MLSIPFQPQDARHSTTTVQTVYLGASGLLMGNPHSRGWVHQTVRQWLRVARTKAEVRRVMEVWRRVHYLGDPARADRDRNWVVFEPRTFRIHYYMDMPALRTAPVPWYPAAAVTMRYALPSGIPKTLGLESPLQALEVARNFVADDLRTSVRDLSPEILREVVRRMRAGDDWQSVVAGRVKWAPQWLLTFADPGVGHDGGLYRGAGAVFLGDRKGGKTCWGWPLTTEAADRLEAIR